MQTITLIALGKLNADYYAKAAAEYAKRLSAYCRLNIVELPEEPIAEKNASPAVIGEALEKVARAILTAVPKGSSLAALCVEGKQKTSEELAAYLDERAGSGAGDVAFVIGSSHGLADSVKQTASLRLSMSKMTFPHQLARVMLLEQLYRAFSINHGGKYHKGPKRAPRTAGRTPDRCAGRFFAAAAPGVNPDGAPGMRALRRALSFCRCRTAGRQRPAGRGCIFQRFS